MSRNAPINKLIDSVVSPVHYATHEGVLSLGGIKIKVYVLNTGERIFDKDDAGLFGDSITLPQKIEIATPEYIKVGTAKIRCYTDENGECYFDADDVKKAWPELKRIMQESEE